MKFKKQIISLILSVSMITALPLSANASKEFISPHAPDNPPYTLTVPTADGRLSVSSDGKTATLFAPNVNSSKGWHDADKNGNNDGRLCWAAASSNIIAWYLDSVELNGKTDISQCERNANRIFDKFRANWDGLCGEDYLYGVSWYFGGSLPTGGTPDNLLNKNSGGYLKFLPHVGDGFFMTDPASSTTVFGNYSEKFPFADDLNGLFNESDPFYSLESFSKSILYQLRYGACAIMVGAESASAGSSHAITLWGCDYDINTGLVSAIYTTDSDDGFMGTNYFKKIGVKRKPYSNGIRLTNYSLPGGALTKFMGSMVLFADGVVNSPDAANYSFNDINCDGYDNASDLIALKKVIINPAAANGNAILKSDTNFDTKINILDLVTLKKNII